MLSPDAFPEFFESIHGNPPFPWQTGLLRDLAGRGTWPEVLDLPTGSGKTAALDIAVFHLALSAGYPGRTAPVRIAFVVDRRLVVDEAFDRARRLQKALQCAKDGVVRTVADALRAFSTTGEPLAIARLRGGVPSEDDWARTPCQPTVLCSTVDQVGSRLMFRGYGVSERMAPVHAGLLGSDALILLDEAHLSEPFRQTLLALAEPSLRGPDKAPFATALLSATPGVSSRSEPFRLQADDHSNPVLAARLHASKPVAFREVADTDDARAMALATEAVSLAGRLRAAGIAAPIIGVVANRVGRARTAFDQLGREQRATLVIGRSRPVDRDRVAAELAPFKTGSARPGEPQFIVATQTLEAGVDIDLDGLVTEAAALDALRQRFGRVNRAGRPVAAQGVVLGARRARKPDPTYGEATVATIATLWPADDAVADFGIDPMQARLADVDLARLLAPRRDAPVLMPAYVPLWMQTAPKAVADPEPALFLHGAEREPASVQIVWRGDLDLSRKEELLKQLIELTPPRPGEVLELPLWAAQQWLRGGRPDLADVAEPTRDAGGDANRAVFRWAGQDDERTGIVRAGDIRSGDVLVVPSFYGGCDQYGWAPKDERPVKDVFDVANAASGGRFEVVRVSPGAVPGLAAGLQALDQTPRVLEVVDAVMGLLEAPEGADDGDEAAAKPRAIIAELKERLGSIHRQNFIRAHFPYDIEGPGTRSGAVLIAKRAQPDTNAEDSGGGTTADDALAAYAAKEETLRDHTDRVVSTITGFVKAMGLDDIVAADLILAAQLHDGGKADRRFQRVLRTAGPFTSQDAEPLAKSVRAALPTAWELARLPKGWRHEALSVRLAMANPLLAEAHDRALVLYLIGTHHGFGRPFFPQLDPDDKERSFTEVAGLVPPRLDAGPGPHVLGFVLDGPAWGPTARDRHDLRGLDWFTMTRELTARHGAWGLARLEATLRLADHRASGEKITIP